MEQLFLLAIFTASLCEAVPLSEDRIPRNTTTAPYAENVSARPGDKVTLKCQVPANVTLLGAMWTRTDPGEEYVALFLHGHMETENQHASYENRTGMQASWIVHGDLSVVLNNVRSTDNGTYKAYQIKNTKKELICIVHLTITPDDSAGKNLAVTPTTRNYTTEIIIAVVCVIVGLLLIVLGIICYFKNKLPCQPGAIKKAKEDRL
ncbi:programmed cell death 1 ligand 1-like [Scomber scombrus]|uniref:Programmed cell death 1 ligand 1-like n=1 Tax=Scomber scombrus TaxID=13677 RepID=A0AAV1Q9W8_SCOSC